MKKNRIIRFPDKGNKIITVNDYFEHTAGYFKPCNRPKRKPDYVSKAKESIKLSDCLYPVSEWNEALNKNNASSILGINGYSNHYINFDGDLIVFFYTSKVSSRYWYGCDKHGNYIIRESDHWGRAGTCFWKKRTNFKHNNTLMCCKTYI